MIKVFPSALPQAADGEPVSRALKQGADLVRKADVRRPTQETKQWDAVYDEDVDGIEDLSVPQLPLMVVHGLYLLVTDFVRRNTRR